MSWLTGLWGGVVTGFGKVKLWLAIVAAVLASIAGAWLAGRREGRVVANAGEQARADEQTAVNNETAAQSQAANAQVRHDVEVQTAKLPDAPAQQVATAAPDTAAGKLRDDGWTR